jgi:hypothetical protein
MAYTADDRRVTLAHARRVQKALRVPHKLDEALAYIKSVADLMPPITDAQRADLAALLAGADGDGDR